MTTHPLAWDNLGVVPYEEAWTKQKSLRAQRIEGKIPDTMLLLQHPPTITLGRLRGEKSLRKSIETLETEGVHVVRSDRGGDATLHAPKQLVGYLIVHLRDRKLPQFVEAIAGAFCAYFSSFGLNAYYDHKYPGVWIGNNKIVAFGFHLHQNVTMHGFACNIDTDLSLFDLIIPCGLNDKGVTSLVKETQKDIAIEDVVTPIAVSIADALGQRPDRGLTQAEGS